MSKTSCLALILAIVLVLASPSLQQYPMTVSVTGGFVFKDVVAIPNKKNSDVAIVGYIPWDGTKTRYKMSNFISQENFTVSETESAAGPYNWTKDVTLNSFCITKNNVPNYPV